MSYRRLLEVPSLATYAVGLGVLVLFSGCQGSGSLPGPGDGGRADTPLGPDTGVVINIDGGTPVSPIDGQCDALTSCQVTGGQYCGIIGDRCGGALNCGDCPTGQTCVSGQCT